jgi:hypothetical protein
MSSFKDFKKKFVINNNKEMPQAVVELPSNRQKTLIKAMKVKEQKEFLKALEKRDEFLINEAFDKILTSCVLTVNEEPFDGDKLCVQDRMFLLIKIRQLSSGDKILIPHVIVVDEKEKTEQIEVDMTKFNVVYKEGNLNKEVLLNPTTKIILGPSTRKNEKDLENWIKTKGVSKDSLVERRFAAYATLIKEIWFIPEDSKDKSWEQVTLNFAEAVEFVTDACTEKDLKQFEEYAKELDFGIKLIVPVNVEGYNNPEEEVNLISFFIN